MFEKSLYDLIRGLRNHKGNEKEYIQNSLKECRAEIRGQDMDLKATALLKLVYLEMFGYDMSWASFHILEVMSSPKYLQKRVGYLGAVQSFRSDTEVLMLATNLLKKDITSTSPITMSLPIITLPHIITSSLALSVLSDLLPRLTHSLPAIRKKTIVTLYRLALVYPETLRPAWPKIKERLMDESEDTSVTAAIVNVVCELGWRRPQDFLPLAPRLFELLVDSGNNWMAIKLIKLFATLTPLEPRLVRKLLPPLTSIIRTTPAMSLLYECINGIIQGGILEGSDDSLGGEEIATLCVNKLRGMILVEGDANLKYVALLAFNKIVLTHPFLVAQQEDVIMECIDSPDISIRLRALDLVVGMVSSENLMSIVGRLMRQLKDSRSATTDELTPRATTIEPAADSDDESPEVVIKADGGKSQDPLLPDDYKVDVITRILEMCSNDDYRNLVDFDWYIDILIQLVRSAPSQNAATRLQDQVEEATRPDVSERIGDELRNVAVKVKDVRLQAVQAAESILVSTYNDNTSQLNAGSGALKPTAWITGEYASCLKSPDATLTALLGLAKSSTPAANVIIFLQAITKVFAFITGDTGGFWTAETKTMAALLMARVIHALEPLGIHPDLEVQERAVQFSELFKLASEAASAQDVPRSDHDERIEAPLMLMHAVPSLFTGLELNSVAAGAQKNVPLPIGFDLDQPILPNLGDLLKAAESVYLGEPDQDEFEAFYHQPPSKSIAPAESAISRLGGATDEPVRFYQQGSEESYLDADILARRRAQRIERNKDDPFYIGATDSNSGKSSPLHNIIQNSNGPDTDIDAIPIMSLELGKLNLNYSGQAPPKKPSTTKTFQRIQVAADETLATSGTSTPRNYDSENSGDVPYRSRPTKGKSLLQVDSSHIGAFSLEDEHAIDFEQQQREEAEMVKAMREVERLRLEMQRANERIEAAHGVPLEGTVVKKKKKKKIQPIEAGSEEVMTTKRKVKKKKQVEDVGGQEAEGIGAAELGTVDIVRRKKKRKAEIDGGSPRVLESVQGEETVQNQFEH